MPCGMLPSTVGSCGQPKRSIARHLLPPYWSAAAARRFVSCSMPPLRKCCTSKCCHSAHLPTPPQPVSCAAAPLLCAAAACLAHDCSHGASALSLLLTRPACFPALLQRPSGLKTVTMPTTRCRDWKTMASLPARLPVLTPAACWTHPTAWPQGRPQLQGTASTNLPAEPCRLRPACPTRPTRSPSPRALPLTAILCYSMAASSLASP